MARVAFILEPDQPHPLIDPVVRRLIQELSESQHQLRVLASRDFAAAGQPTSPRVEWLSPFQSAKIWELPRIFAALVPFQPEIVHIIPARTVTTLSLMSILPQALRGSLRSRLVATVWDQSASKSHLKQASWVGAFDTILSPYQPSGSAQPVWHKLPVSVLAPQSGLELGVRRELTVFAPGNYEDWLTRDTGWAGWINLLSALPQWRLQLGCSWNSIPVRQRHRWREALVDSKVAERISLSGEDDEKALVAHLHLADLVVLSHLRPQSLIYDYAQTWASRYGRSIFTETIERENLQHLIQVGIQARQRAESTNRHNSEFSPEMESTDRGANQVSRLYAQLLLS